MKSQYLLRDDSQHPLYLALGRSDTDRLDAYRALFRASLDQTAIDDIRLAQSRFRLTHERTDALVRQNVVAQLANIRTHPSVAVALAQHRLNLHGWIYDIENGVIDALDGATGDFVPLADNPQVVAT